MYTRAVVGCTVGLSRNNNVDVTAHSFGGAPDNKRWLKLLASGITHCSLCAFSLQAVDTGWSKIGARFKDFLFYFSFITILSLLVLSSAASFKNPAYEVFIDQFAGSIIKREFRLLPIGVLQQTIPFVEIDVITGEFVKLKERTFPSSPPEKFYYNYMVTIVTQDGRQIKLESFNRIPLGVIPPKATSIADEIAKVSGVSVELRGRFVPAWEDEY